MVNVSVREVKLNVFITISKQPKIENKSSDEANMNNAARKTIEDH